ncbi:MAG TPA: ATP-binding protein [Candidatus Saccharimonadales bacterium]|nr:ATP-binding protein [Candidatus Saccharimonadales bacterium]
MNSEERIQQLAAFPRNDPNPVLEFAADGTLTYANDAARHLAISLGQDAVASILPPETGAIVVQCLATGRNKTNMQSTVQHHTLAWSFIPINQSKTVHCYASDITERLNLEAQLRHSVKMEAVGQLAAGVAHDFNNILTIIQGHSALLLQSGGLPPQHEKSIHQISAAAVRAGKLINQLLMFSRKQVMQPRNANLNDIISNLSPMLQGLVGEHVTFQFFPSADLPPLYVDLGMMEQVLVNLVLNARDAMPRGGRLTLCTSQQTLDPVASVLNPEARPGRFVCLSVADTGSGMDSTTLSHLFEPFFTTKETGKGTGLGLATVYGIMKQHEGWISVDSHVGSGTTFTLFLPNSGQAVEAGSPQAPVAAPSDARAAQLNMARGDETILVVEDEPALRDLVVNILEYCGYRIYQAQTGPDAVAVWEKHRSEIKLLLTDMVMPGGMSGRQLAERLQEDTPHLRVIYTSGYSPGMAGKDIALLEGFNFLAKPYPPSRLAQVVRESLDGKAPTAPARK